LGVLIGGKWQKQVILTKEVDGFIPYLTQVISVYSKVLFGGGKAVQGNRMALGLVPAMTAA
jgi:hypothetical protein